MHRRCKPCLRVALLPVFFVCKTRKRWYFSRHDPNCFSTSLLEGRPRGNKRHDCGARRAAGATNMEYRISSIIVDPYSCHMQSETDMLMGSKASVGKLEGQKARCGEGSPAEVRPSNWSTVPAQTLSKVEAPQQSNRELHNTRTLRAYIRRIDTKTNKAKRFASSIYPICASYWNEPRIYPPELLSYETAERTSNQT